MTSAYGSLFDEILNRLRRGVPLPCRAEVKTVPPWDMPDLQGDCYVWTDKRGNQRVTIRIARGMSNEGAIDTLIHEWAHAMDWIKRGPTNHWHRKSWGAELSKAYRVVHGEL